MDAVFHALAEPNRRAILRLILDEERSAGDIARQFSVSRPAISQHLAVLREAGLIRERRDGTSRMYRADPNRIEDLRVELSDFWDERLRRLKRAVEEET